MKTISKSVNKGRQSIEYKEILKGNHNKLKIFIKSDSYDFQSYARIERWNGDEWKMIDSIHYSEMNTPSCMISDIHNQPTNLTPDVLMLNNERFFKKDRDALLKIAKEIIS